jgi:hypothetical protein
MAAITLGQVARGIDRTRVRGNAQPDGLFELTNAYVTPARTLRKRPGFRRIGTVPHNSSPFAGQGWTALGLASLNGRIVVFDSQVRAWTVPAGDRVPARVATLRFMPRAGETGAAASGWQLNSVRTIGVFLGRLYVVARWIKAGDERLIHYWLQEPAAWAPQQAYGVGDQVRPSVDNGFVYRIAQLPTYAAWAPNTEYQLNARVQPKTFNGYSYALVAHEGTPLLSGDTEPRWPTTTKPPGHRVKEVRPITSATTARPPSEQTPPPPPPDRGPGSAVLDEYGLGHRGRPGYGPDIGIYEQAP